MPEILPSRFLLVFIRLPLKPGVQAGQAAPEVPLPMRPRRVEAEELPHIRLLVQLQGPFTIIMLGPGEYQMLLQQQRLQQQVRVILVTQLRVVGMLQILLFSLPLVDLVARESLAQLVRLLHVIRPQMHITVATGLQTAGPGAAVAAVQQVVAVPVATQILPAALALWQQSRASQVTQELSWLALSAEPAESAGLLAPVVMYRVPAVAAKDMAEPVQAQGPMAG